MKTEFYKYIIDYEYGVGNFYTTEADRKKALSQFLNCASECFGIRKSLGETTLKIRYKNVQLPIPYRNKGGDLLLTHNGGDEILFTTRVRGKDNEYWKLHSEWGDWCSCKKKGKEELSCEVHHFWVKNHDKVCKEKH